MKILLIEDCKVVQQQIIGLLSESQVSCVPSLKDGIQAATEEGADCVILDLNLDDSHGPDTVRAFRQVWQGPIVVVSGCDSQWEVNGERVLSKDLLRTPQNKRLLEKMIQAAVSESKTQMLTRQRIPVSVGSVCKPVSTLLGVGAGTKLFSLGAEI